jgi:hypothetical protein
MVIVAGRSTQPLERILSEQSAITTALAVWGALLSSITFGWNIYRDYIQRGRLRVHCFIGQIAGDSRISSKKKWLMWRVTNIGKEPVVLTNIGGNLGATSFAINTREPLPATLKPGEYFSSQTYDFSVLTSELRYLAAYDSLGRTFKAPAKNVRELKRKYGSGEYDSESAL